MSSTEGAAKAICSCSIICFLRFTPSFMSWISSWIFRIASMSISGRGRTTGQVNVNGNNVIHSLNNGVVVKHAATR